VLHIKIDPTVIDVNVHPRKQEVRFENEQNIFRNMYHCVFHTLEKVSLISGQDSQENTSTQTSS
jgi:DNA mismatch repair protein MutL